MTDKHHNTYSNLGTASEDLLAFILPVAAVLISSKIIDINRIKVLLDGLPESDECTSCEPSVRCDECDNSIPASQTIGRPSVRTDIVVVDGIDISLTFGEERLIEI